MKKIFALILSVIMILSAVTSLASGDLVLTAKDVSEKSETGVTVAETVKGWKDGGYVGYKVNMDGVKSISMEVNAVIVDWTNGEAFRLKLDNPVNGEFLGYLVIDKNGTHT